ncbi:hypothetical protein IQ07DRAFT_259125 [Pyrenochaeta sp. DS3sAY3a]|nr:hypothetical protein IQ07DRAFT_259125 [Pyrenochaeta sp. DS3sAY3a]
MAPRRTSTKKTGDRLEDLTPDQLGAWMQIHYTYMSTESCEVSPELAARVGMTKEDLECQLLARDEHLHERLSPETEVMRINRAIARSIPNENIPSADHCYDEAIELAARIFKSWGFLNFMLKRHERLIRELWNKLDHAEKKAVLLRAWPDMCERHRPDMAHMSRDPLDPTYHDDYPNSINYPYINLEDLLMPNALLIFLNSRGRNDPDIFAYSDLELSPLGKCPDEFLSRRQDLCTMSFLGKKSADEYGDFLEWKTVTELKNSINAGRSVHIDHGMHILLTQDDLLRFLCRCVGILLKGLDPATLCAAGEQPEPPRLTESDHPALGPTIFSKLSPYRVPSKLDLSRLQALAHAQKIQAINHVIALRQDPAYFEETVELFRDHRPEMLPFSSGRMHDGSKDFPLYNKTIAHLASDAHCQVFFWDQIHESLIKLEALSLKYAHEVDVGKDLPREYLRHFIETRLLLQNFSLDLITVITSMYRSSPPLRGYYGAIEDRSNSRIRRIVRTEAIKDSAALNPIVRQVLDLLDCFQNKGWRKHFTLYNLLDELERLTRDEADAKDLISPLLASYFSQLSVVVVCLDQFHQYQPWAKRIEQAIKNNEENVRLRYDQKLGKWGKSENAPPSFLTMEIYRAGNPKDGKFYYPSNKPRNRETIMAMISAEVALDTFWKKANAVWQRHAGATPASLVHGIIGEPFLHRTAPWVEPVKRRQLKLQIEEFPTRVHDSDKEITGNFNKHATSSKQKVKTRGVPAMEREQGPPDPPPIAAPTPAAPPKIALNKRSMKVFKTLFHSPNSPDQPGEIAWREFMHAMVSVGFNAEKLHGSAWHFWPGKNLHLDKSISFHEPHPSPKLPFTWARKYGRSLTMTFGWTAETFTLA